MSTRRQTPLRILIVDDNAEGAAMLAELITRDGDETRVAHDGAGALAAMPEFRPHLVLLDIGLPGDDGYAVAKQIGSDPAFGEVVLFAVTGHDRPDDRRRVTEAGFAAHLVKPLQMEDLRRAIDEKLG